MSRSELRVQRVLGVSRFREPGGAPATEEEVQALGSGSGLAVPAGSGPVWGGGPGLGSRGRVSEEWCSPRYATTPPCRPRMLLPGPPLRRQERAGGLRAAGRGTGPGAPRPATALT